MFVIYPILLFGQSVINDTTVILDAREVYVISYKVDSVVFVSEERPCEIISEYLQEDLGSYCYLIKGQIKEVTYKSDTSIYKTIADLKKIKYIVTINPPQIGKTYNLTAYNSSSNKYITWGKEIALKANYKYSFKHKVGYFTGLIKCYRSNFIQSLLVKLKLKNPKKVKFKKEVKNPYEEFILQQKED